MAHFSVVRAEHMVEVQDKLYLVQRAEFTCLVAEARSDPAYELKA